MLDLTRYPPLQLGTRSAIKNDDFARDQFSLKFCIGTHSMFS